jgi:hypothetical protein
MFSAVLVWPDQPCLQFNARVQSFRLALIAPCMYGTAAFVGQIKHQRHPLHLNLSSRFVCTGCRFKQVENANQLLSSMLSDVTKTTYFRYFKVNIFCDCPLWPEDGMCSLEACSVCPCEPDEVPPAWRKEEEEGCQNLCAQPLSPCWPRDTTVTCCHT